MPESASTPSSGPKNRRVPTTQQGGKAGRAPEQTFEEAAYLKKLVDGGKPIRVRMTDGEEVTGSIEYYDQSFIRLTRVGAPNLFIFKHDIKYIVEEA